MGGVPYLLGVVPQWIGEAEIAWIKDQPSIEIAVHGLAHARGEFDAPLPVVLERVQRGRRMLGGVAVAIPPYNWVTPTLIEAFDLAGYQAFTTGPETDPAALRYLAVSGRKLREVGSPWYGRASEFVPRWRAGERLSREACCTLHFTWEFGDRFGSLRELVGLIAPEVISWKSAGIYK